jgi:hypothetical protein
MEKFIYETRPYFFLAIALKALGAGASPLMSASAALLFGASAYVIFSRLNNRGYFAAAYTRR